MLVALAISSLALWLRCRGSRLLPRLEQIRFVRGLLDTVAKAPGQAWRRPAIAVAGAGCNMPVLLVDGATLLACLQALGQPASYGTAFIALVMASIVVTLSPIPLGLGTFEATLTTTLRLLGVPVKLPTPQPCCCPS